MGNFLGGSTSGLRIATWNLQRFVDKRARNPRVLEVVCATILRHKFDVVVIQELGSKDALEKICDELNHPTLPKVKVMENKKHWQYCTSSDYTGRMYQSVEYNGFLWNESSKLELLESKILEKDEFTRNPFLGQFRFNRDWTFSLISVHLHAEGLRKEHTDRLQAEVNSLQLLVKGHSRDTDVILLGDFNCNPSLPWFDSLRRSGYSSIFGEYEVTNISAANLGGSKCYDNIWISSRLKKSRYGGQAPYHEVVRTDLVVSKKKSSDKTETVSDHCPIWASL